jgi:hypothetical protein
MSSLSIYDDCRSASSIMPRGNARPSRNLSSFPETDRCTSVTPRIAGTFCRMRWFVRYARGEARLCRRPKPILLER